MNLLAVLVGHLAALLAVQDETLQGDQRVNVKTGWYLKMPSRLAESVGKANDGDEVTVLGVEGKYAKVTVKKTGMTAYIDKSVLIPPQKWARSAADEKEGKEMAAQGLEGQKGLNPDTEKEYRSQGGPRTEKAYRDLDALMARPDYKDERPKLEAQLAAFRKAGKLGEFSSVK
jgi:hypothetical protein